MDVRDKKYFGGFFEISERVGLREHYTLEQRMKDVSIFLRKSGDSERELMLAYFNEIVSIATDERQMDEAYVVLCGFYWQVLKMIRKLEELGQLRVMKALPTENPLATDNAAREAFAAHLPKADDAVVPDVCDLDKDVLHI